MNRLLIPLVSTLIMSGCSVKESITTSNHNNACQIMKENKDWFESSYRSSKKWGIPISVQLSVIKHESSFNSDASARQSTAYGFSQALNGTFSEYKNETGNKLAVRGSYRDSTDFMGWYFNKSINQLNFNRYDAKTFYLSYHDGISGYKKGTHLRKKWLINKSKKVQSVSDKYRSQLNQCKLKI